jgi:hypothetical protein
MDKYEIMFYKNDEEIDISELPEEYLNGIIQACQSEVASRNRLERVFKRMVTS